MELVKIYSASGLLEAEMIKSFLESYGITVFLNQESIGRTYGLSVGPLGLVEVLVPESRIEEAESLLNDVWQENRNNFEENEHRGDHFSEDPEQGDTDFGKQE